jgi:hypothetical protein
MGTERAQRVERTYRHRECGGRTTVDGMALVYVTHIFDHPDRTDCAQCGDAFPMHEFEWDDTGESLTDYYSRHAGRFKGLDRFLGSNSVVFALIAAGAIVGGVAGFLVGRTWGALGTVIAVVLGVALLGFVGFVAGAAISQHVCRRVLGTDDFTSLD